MERNFYRTHEKDCTLPQVQQFIQKMEAACGMKSTALNCFIYTRSGIVLAANYCVENNTFIGSFMTTWAFDQMLEAMNKYSDGMPCGYFAWAHGYGMPLNAVYLEATYVMENIEKMGHLFNQMNTIGDPAASIMYSLVEYKDVKPDGEYGVSEEWNMLGIFGKLHSAIDALGKAYREDSGDIKERTLTIMPVQFGKLLPVGQRPQIGSSFYIE